MWRKGSIAINGISLTVNEIRNNRIYSECNTAYKRNDNIGDWKSGDKVNLEFDIIGKYIAHFLSKVKRNNLTLEKLMESGW